jgi:hypothetical protein
MPGEFVIYQSRDTDSQHYLSMMTTQARLALQTGCRVILVRTNFSMDKEVINSIVSVLNSPFSRSLTAQIKYASSCRTTCQINVMCERYFVENLAFNTQSSEITIKYVLNRGQL